MKRYATQIKVGLFLSVLSIACMVFMMNALNLETPQEYMKMFEIMFIGMYSIGMVSMTDGLCKIWRLSSK